MIPGTNGSIPKPLTRHWRNCLSCSGRRSRCGIWMACPSPTSPSTWAAVCMRPRRCWRARARRCVASMRKDRAMPADPLDNLRLPIVPIEPRPAFADALLQWLQQEARPAPRHETPTIRYFVQDMDDAVTFYTRHLGFEEELRPNPAFAMLYRGDLR